MFCPPSGLFAFRTVPSGLFACIPYVKHDGNDLVVISCISGKDELIVVAAASVEPFIGEGFIITLSHTDRLPVMIPNYIGVFLIHFEFGKCMALELRPTQGTQRKCSRKSYFLALESREL
jgi:hypothetical protein